MIKPGSRKRRFLCEMISIFEKDHLQFHLVKMIFLLEIKYIGLWIDRHLTRKQRTQTRNKTWSSVMVCLLALAVIDHSRQIDAWRFLRAFRGEVSQLVKNLSANAGDASPLWAPKMIEQGFDFWVWKISWRRKWQPTPVDLLGKFHGWRSLVVYSPWSHEESDTTVCVLVRAHTHTLQISRQKNSYLFSPRYFFCFYWVLLFCFFFLLSYVERDCRKNFF